MKRALSILLALLVFAVAPLQAAAIVDVNTADRAQLESVRGIGPHMAEAILKERNRGGVFASADDLAARVPGIGAKRAEKLRAAGLRIGTTGGIASVKSSQGLEKSAASHTTAPANLSTQKTVGLGAKASATGAKSTAPTVPTKSAAPAAPAAPPAHP